MSSSSVSGVVGVGGQLLHGAMRRRTTPRNELATFVLDMSTTCHCTSDVKLLHDLQDLRHQIVYGAGGYSAQVVGRGFIRTPEFSIPEVFFVPGLSPGRSIISEKKLVDDHGLIVEYPGRGILVKTRQGKVVGRGHLIHGLYILDFLIIGQQDDEVDDDAASLVAQVSQQESSEANERPTDERHSQGLDDGTRLFEQQLELHPVVPPWFQLLSEVKDLWNPILLILACGYHYLNKKVVAVFILGLLFWAHTFGALDLVFNTSLGMIRWSSDNTHGRVLVGINHDTEHKGGDGIISVSLGMTGGNANDSKEDHKALAPWISNQTSDQPVEDYGETAEKQNRTGQPRPPTTNKATKTIMVRWIVIASTISVFVVLCCITLVLWYKCCRIRAQQIDNPEDQGELGLAMGPRQSQNDGLADPEDQVELGVATGPIQFQYDELAVATGNFTHENMLGHGASGVVYRGRLRIPDRYVAIKVLTMTESPLMSQRLNDFKSEVKVITQLKHKNIVELVGWCSSNKGLLLVYELIAKGSLDKHLYNPLEILSWDQRYKIILDLGSALTYLHVYCKEFVFHGDIKPQNVLIDATYNAKLGDFGTTRLIQHGADPQPTDNVPGTFGYMDPVFLRTGVRCPEADMYSFGITILEIACANRQVSGLPAMVHNLYDQGRTLQEPSRVLHAADRRLNGEFDQQQMERVLVTGLLCAHQDQRQRPTIVEAMDILRSADGNLPLVPAVLGPQRIRSMELDYGESSSSHDATPFHTCNDSAYLLAGS